MDKPFLSFDQQLEKLVNDYNLEISNHDFALIALSSVSYYDLVNGYKFIYMPDDKTFLPGTTLEHLFAFHIFNKNVQSILFKYSTYAENSFKTILAHVIAEHLGAHQSDYLNPKKYKYIQDPKKKAAFFYSINMLKELCQKCTDTPTSHYIQNKDHIPPWILFRNATFSDTCELFSALKTIEKSKVSNQFNVFNESGLKYEQKVAILTSSFRVVRKFRNKIAHNLNFLSYRNAILWKEANFLFIGTLIKEEELDTMFDNVWASILAMVIVLNNKYLVYYFLTELSSYLSVQEELIETYCLHSGIPKDYSTRIEAYLSTFEI